MKRLAFLIGIVLLTLALLTTGAELAARAIIGTEGIGSPIMSLHEVWRTVAPKSYQAVTTGESSGWLVLMLNLPGWVLFGLPGLALVYAFSSKSDDTQGAQEIQEYEESLLLYDELANAARKDGYTGAIDDLAPSDPSHTVPADAHYAEDPVDPALMPQRDFLLGPKSE